MSVESAQRAVTVATSNISLPPDTPNVPTITGYAHYYTSPEPSPLLIAAGKDIPLNLSFEIVEDDEHIFISKAATVWQGAIPKRAMIPLPLRVRAIPTGTAQQHAVIRVADHTNDPSTMSHDMQICTDENHRDTSQGRAHIFQSISVTPGLQSWSFEELRAECYSQSCLATGGAPRAVPPGAPSWMIIPPAFTACTINV